LLTNFYERPFQPDVGSNLDKLLFEPATSLTANILESEIINVITNYEPRVSIDVLQVTLNPDKNSFSVYLSFFVGNNTVPTAVNLILQRSR
jgi:phage baseplate assembly protein W